MNKIKILTQYIPINRDRENALKKITNCSGAGWSIVTVVEEIGDLNNQREDAPLIKPNTRGYENGFYNKM